MELSYLKIFITIVLTVIGWIIGHYFTSKRSANNKRRDLSTEFLIEAYRVLTTEIAHREETLERATKIENLVADIQLFGSPEQIDLAKKMADDVASGEKFELDPLINSLRKSLRQELSLASIDGNVRWLRFNGPTKDKSN